MNKPDFFIVGAPKCGTSALCTYLDQHPAICIASDKEPDFFGSDLQGKRAATTLDAYLALFRCHPEKLWGEGSTWYLFSKQAAQEIYAHNPQAKIIIMLRNPVDFMYAMHSQSVFVADEDILDFEQALQAEPDRKQGRRIPRGCTQPEALLYTEAARFCEQVQRYLHVFGREAVHIIIYDDFRRDTSGVYRAILEFLGVDTTFHPDFRIINPNKTLRWQAFNWFLRRPSPWLRRLYRATSTPAMRYAIRRTSAFLNTRYVPRSPLPPRLRNELNWQLTPEVVCLSELIGRDLSSWITR